MDIGLLSVRTSGVCAENLDYDVVYAPMFIKF